MVDMKVKKVPLRMCVACRQMLEKSTLLRLVKSNNEVNIDEGGKANGRGAYICKNAECIKICIKKRLFNRAFSCQIANEIYDLIAKEISDKPSLCRQIRGING